MAQTDILNPVRGWDPQLGDSMNPDYGFTRKRAATRGVQKAVGGTPYTRELGNTGHTFVFSWLGRTLNCVRRLKWYYEQYEDGFFTLIDWDGGGRHYVGRFTTEIAAIETANNKWDVQNVQFDEIPTLPMLQYPSNWAADAIDLYPFNDFGDQKLATQGTWATTVRNFGGVLRTTADDAGAIGDWAQHEYRGYGFQLWMLTGAGQGTVNIFLDGIEVGTVNLATSGVALVPVKVFEKVNVPLDIHRVQAVQTLALPCSWFKLRVMR
jgi:hypothetical protein